MNYKSAKIHALKIKHREYAIYDNNLRVLSVKIKPC